MAILDFKILSMGHTGVKPRIIYLYTDNTVAEVLVAGYLNNLVNSQKFPLAESDIALVNTKSTPSSTTDNPSWYGVEKSGDNWSLVAEGGAGNVELPTRANYIAHFTDAVGTISDDAANVINDGNITAGTSAIRGTLTAFGGFAGGSVTLSSDDENTTNNTNIQVLDQTFDNLLYINDLESSSGSILISTINNTIPGANIITFDTIITYQDLQTAGSKTLYAPLATPLVTRQYRIRDLYINSAGAGATNFSGGDRDLTISGGSTITIDYSVIPSASVTTLTNARWGSTDVPFPASNSIADRYGSNGTTGTLRVEYSSGTTDYTAGVMYISGVLELVLSAAP